MPGVTETVGLVAAILSIAGRIEQLTANAQRSREKCNQLKEHVISIRDLLNQLEKEEWTPDLATEGVLRNLQTALDEAERLVRSCELKKPLFQRMINSQEKARKFDALDERISRILDRFQLVNIMLIVNLQKDRFFMKVLDKLLQHGACRSLPKSEREELKSSVRHVTDREKMLPDARKMLERIERDLADGRDLARNQMPGGGGGGGGNGESTAEDVVGIAKDVVQQAVKARHKRAQVQRLAQLAQQVVDLMQDLQAFGLTRDRETRALVNKLKADIQDAHRIVLSNQRRFLLSSFRFSSQRTTKILNVVYSIEFILHVLPVMAMTHNK